MSSAHKIASLADCQVDAVRGFLPSTDPLKSLSETYEPWETLAMRLNGLMAAGACRKAIENLPTLDTTSLKTNAERERAMLLLSVFGNAYVWGDVTPATQIPSTLAIPWNQVAIAIDRPMITSHASIVLNNWQRIDPTGPIALGNIDTLQTFLGGMDERWFYLVTVAIEAAGGEALPAIVDAQLAVIESNQDKLTTALETVHTVIQRITALLARMEERCDPHIFYHRVRPFLAGWPKPGITYNGVDKESRVLIGGSAAQSSLIQTIDAALGVEHHDPRSRPFLMAVRAYMPIGHRRFVEQIESGPSIRQFLSGSVNTTKAASIYRQCLEALEQFRRDHIRITTRYITAAAGDLEKARGTGGTEFAGFLKAARQETTATHLT